MLGELLASQMHHHLVHKILKQKSDENVSYVGQKAVGDFMLEKIYKVSAVYPWNTMIKKATGEKLTPKYFVSQFIN
jgi:peptidyl-dipeptidase A